MGKTLFSYDVSPKSFTPTENGSTFAEQALMRSNFRLLYNLRHYIQGLTYESPKQHGRENILSLIWQQIYVQSDIVGKYLITFFILKELISNRVKDMISGECDRNCNLNSVVTSSSLS